MPREGSVNFIVNLLILLPARIASYFSWVGPLVMRLVVGYVFMLTGWAKLNHLPQMIQNFTEWRIPFPDILTPFASGVECFGGVLLILGLFTRIPAAMLVVVMIVAISVAKWKDAYAKYVATATPNHDSHTGTSQFMMMRSAPVKMRHRCANATITKIAPAMST